MERRTTVRRDRLRGSPRGAALALTVVVALVSGCGGQDDEAADGAVIVDVGDVVGGEAVQGFEAGDSRPALLAELGAPDAFVVTVDELDGAVSRFESWSWFAARTQIDLVDGEVLWSVEVDELPDGALLPLGYDPTEFTMLASMVDVRALLGDVELHEVDASDDFEVAGARLLVGEQILMAFVDDRLVYVETVPLAAGAPEVVG